MTTQTIQRQGDKGVVLPLASIGDGWREIRITDHGHRPSWKRYGDGTANLTIHTHDDRKHLGIDLEEVSHPNGHNKGGSTGRRCMFTLDHEAAQAVFDLMWDAGFRPESVVQSGSGTVFSAAGKMQAGLRKIEELAKPGQEMGIAAAIETICDVWNAAREALA